MTVKRYHEMGVTSCTATVLDCKALNDGNFDILLDETAIYPEGGGQLSDTGYIGSARVLHARDDGGYVWHTCDRAVAIGSKVDVKADKDVRLDHTQQHTGEHMLSGIAHTLFGCTNVGFHMAEDIVTVDFDKQLTQEQIDELELRVNEAIQRNEPTVIRTVTPEEYETIDIRKKAKGLKGEITIVYAGGVDSCTCCGTHCERAGEVGLLKIQSHTNYKGGTRIYFNCGMRAVILMQQDNARMDTIARRFSTSADRAVDAVIKQGDELADIKKELKRRTDALFAYRADELYAASAVKEECHVCILLCLCSVQLFLTLAREIFAECIFHILFREEDVYTLERCIVWSHAVVLQILHGLHTLFGHILLGEHNGKFLSAVVAEVDEDNHIALFNHTVY